jgi:hypothetical protein
MKFNKNLLKSNEYVNDNHAEMVSTLEIKINKLKEEASNISIEITQGELIIASTLTKTAINILDNIKKRLDICQENKET